MGFCKDFVNLIVYRVYCTFCVVRCVSTLCTYRSLGRFNDNVFSRVFVRECVTGMDRVVTGEHESIYSNIYIYLINLAFERPRRQWDNILNIIHKKTHSGFYDTVSVLCPLENVTSGVVRLGFVLEVNLYFHELVQFVS